MRWNLYVAALAASWGLISVIVAHVDLSATVLVFWRVAIAAVTVTVACAVVGRTDLLRVPAQRRLLVAVGVVLAVHWYLFFETIKLSSVAVAVLTVYTAPVFLALLAPLFLPERRSRVALVALVPAAAGLVLMSTWGPGGTHARPLAIVMRDRRRAHLCIARDRHEAAAGADGARHDHRVELRDRRARARALPRHGRAGRAAGLRDLLRAPARDRLHRALGLHLRRACSRT